MTRHGVVEGKKRKAIDLAEASVSPPPLKRRVFSQDHIPGGLPHSADPACYASPFHLSKIQGLPESANGDTVSLADLLGDPLIKECWLFDYLFDIDWIMTHVDPDVRHLIQIKVVHGSWRQDDPNKIAIDEAASRYPNIEAVTAYMPEAFGTHHSKMMVLFRHDGECEVVIHTANMIRRDWTSMTQAMWISPRLPLCSANKGCAESPAGSGDRFKYDLLRYLSFYGHNRTGKLTSHLESYDFSSVRAAFIGSVPNRLSLDKDTRPESLWGWPYLRHILRQVPMHADTSRPLIIAQVSSVAYLGEDWINHFLETLGTSTSSTALAPKARVKVMFPTSEEIRTCLDGYAAGASIHMRIQSNQAKRQLAFLRPYLARWGGADDTNVSNKKTERAASRERAAPHVKTYIRYSDDDANTIEWAMLTSANLSTQAWGSMPKDGKVRISSYETGVVVWPSMLQKESDASMVPTFQQDTPDRGSYPEYSSKPLIGLRVPYNLPVVSYAKEDEPWIATSAYEETDVKGVTWQPWKAS